jgi:hypothetical protein
MSALLVAASRRWTIPAVIQSGVASGTSPLSVTLPGTVAGRTILALTAGGSSGTLHPGAPWVLAVGATGGLAAARCQIWRRTSPGGDVTCTTTGSAVNSSLVLIEMSGLTTAVLTSGQSADAGGNVTTLDVSAPVMTPPAVVIFVAGAGGGIWTSPAFSGASPLQSAPRMYVAARLLPGLHASTFTNTTARRATAVVAAFRLAKT